MLTAIWVLVVFFILILLVWSGTFPVSDRENEMKDDR